MNNAFEAAPESGFVRVESELRISDNTQREIVVRITDNGEGVLPELERKLFKLFASGKVGCAGLGLAQAKRIFDIPVDRSKWSANMPPDALSKRRSR